VRVGKGADDLAALEVDQVNGRSPGDDEHALGRVERGPAALADAQHRRLAAGRRLPQLDRPRAVSNRGEERAVGRERDAVDASHGAPGVHAHRPALGAGGHLARDQVAVHIADDDQTAVGAEGDRVHHRA